jgi:fructokinase
MNILSIGEVLWDVFGDTEHLGGAALNFAAHARILGHSVSFISAVGEDERGQRVLEKMEAMGLSTRFVRQVDDCPTGIVTVNLDASGQPRFTIHRPAAYDFPALSDGDLKELSSHRPDWIYFGTLFQMSVKAKALTLKLIQSNPEARRFYDVNLRENCYEAPLVYELMSRATAVKLNDQETDMIQSMLGWSYRSLEEFCQGAARRFGWEVLLGEKQGACCWWVAIMSKRTATRSGSRIRSEQATPSPLPFSMAWEGDGLLRKWRTSPIALGPWSPAVPAGLPLGPSRKRRGSAVDRSFVVGV